MGDHTSGVATLVFDSRVLTTTVYEVENTTINDLLISNSTSDVINPPLPNIDLETILNLYEEYRWSRYLGMYGYPILVIIGIFGNLLSLLVMRQKTMIRSSTCFYMAVLAVADIAVLCFGGLRKWISYLTNASAFVISPVTCKIFNFLTYWSFDFAAWILVAMTIERFIAIHFPFSVTKYVTVQRAKIVSTFLGVIFIAINGHFLVTNTVSEKGFCHSLDEYFHFSENIFPWIDATLYSFVPFLVLLLFNILIIVDARRAANRRRTLQASSLNNTLSANLRSNWRFTAMLLSVSLTFLVASAPKAVLIIIKPYTFDFHDGPVLDFHLLAKYTLAESVMNFLTYANHAINFFLYCVSGQKFRQELKRLLRKCVCFNRQRRNRVSSIQIDKVDNARRNSTTAVDRFEIGQTHNSHLELPTMINSGNDNGTAVHISHSTNL